MTILDCEITAEYVNSRSVTQKWYRMSNIRALSINLTRKISTSSKTELNFREGRKRKSTWVHLFGRYAKFSKKLTFLTS